MSDRWPVDTLHQVYLCTSLLEQTVHDAQCVVAVHLLQEPSIVIFVCITTLDNHTPPYSDIVLNVCIEKDRGFVTFNLRRASLVFSTRILGTVYLSLRRMPVLNTWRGLATPTCTTFLLVGSIHQQNLSAEGLRVSSLQPWETLLFQPRNRTVSTNRPAQQCENNHAWSKRGKQHPGNIAWIPQPVRALFPWVKWFSGLQSLAYGKIAVNAWFCSHPE